MAETARLFVQKSLSLIDGDYLPTIDDYLAQLADDDVWWRPVEGANSIGNLLLHLRGNVTEWMIGGVGRRAYVRHRQQEFDERRQIPKADLIEALRSATSEACEIIAAQTDGSLAEPRQILGHEVTVLDAVYHVVEHFGVHTGQIILLAKMRTGEIPEPWRSRTVPVVNG